MFRTAIRAEFGRREEAIHPQDFRTHPSRFVFDKVDELVPTGISNGFSQVVIFQHAIDVETLKGDHAEVINQGAAQFVVKVLALVGDLLMDGGYSMTSFSPAVTALDFAGKTALADLQAPFTDLEVLGLFNLFASAERGKGGQPQVNPDFVRDPLRCDMFDFALNGDEIFTGLGFDTVAFFILPSILR